MKIFNGKIVTLALTLLAANAFAQTLPGGGCTNCPPITNYYAPQPYIPGLKLAVLPPSGTNLFINLLEADPAGTYDIFAASNLVSATWNDVLSGTNGQANFTLPYPFAGVGFLRAARTDVPVTNTAGMTVQFPNNDVNTSLTSAIISGGPAAAMAVLVNDTNFADAVWIPFSAVPYVLLGTNDGTYQVEFGFIGSDGQTNWTSASVTLDTTPPLLVITSPTNNVVAQPVIQLTGYSPERLSSISYDITNASGFVTNQQMFVLDQFYDTNIFEFTTNTFQGFDIPLTNGLNTITIHATDLAGNSATLTTIFTLDYSGKTNPPVVQLYWPQDGMEICGSNIVCRGSVSDPTATVGVQLVDASGVTNTVGSRVGRDGIFYSDNLTLAAGTNHLSFTVTDAAGNTATTNITVMTSSLNLTLNPVVAGQTLVTGTIDDTNYTVYVNGVQATNNGDGTWSATITPIGIGGGAVVVNAIKDGDPSLQQIVQPPQGVFVSQYHWQTQEQDLDTYEYLIDETFNWADGSGGSDDYSEWFIVGSVPIEHDFDHAVWLADNWPQALPDGTTTNTEAFLIRNTLTNTSVSGVASPALNQEHCDLGNPGNRRTADTEMRLVTGGPPGSTQQNLWVITASATAYSNLDDTVGTSVPFNQISIGSLGNLDTNGNLYVLLPDGDPVVTPTVLGFSFFKWLMPTPTEYRPHITANGIDLSSNTPDFCVGQGITFDVAGLPSPVYDLRAIWTLPGTFVNTNSDPNCDLFYEVNTNLLNPPQGTSATHCWYVKDGQMTVSVRVLYRCTPNGRLFDQPLTGKFNVHRPTTAEATPYQPDGTPTAQILAGSLSLGVTGVTNDMNFKHTITTDGFCSGQAGYVQVINSGDIVAGPTTSRTFTGDALDAEFPADRQTTVPANATTTLNKFYDAPAVGLPIAENQTTEDISFSTYLMFKPSGGIWVTLRRIDWELHDTATYNSGWSAISSTFNGQTQTTEIKRDDDKNFDFPHWTTTW